VGTTGLGKSKAWSLGVNAVTVIRYSGASTHSDSSTAATYSSARPSRSGDSSSTSEA
jgi:hypothetical protein